MIVAYLALLFAWEQQPLDYCANCGGHYPPAHFPCPPS